jgi:cell division protein FtsQ
MNTKGEAIMQKGKVLSLEDRIPKIKEHRRRKANRRLILLLSLFFLLIVCVVYFQSPFSQIKRIDIIGNETITEEEVVEASELMVGLNIWKINKKQAKEDLLALPGVKSVDVKIRFPNILNINMEEFATIAFVNTGNKFHPILENGNVLTNNHANSPISAPILSNFIEDDVLIELANQLKLLPPEILNSISEIHYEPKETDKYHINVYMNDGFEVNATILTFSNKMIHYPSIISQLDPNSKGVIDIEVGSFFRAYETEGDEEEDEG